MLESGLFVKLWELLIKEGIGSLTSPWKIEREGRAYTEARRYDMLTMAQTQEDIEQIKQGKRQFLTNGKLVEIDSGKVTDKIDDVSKLEPTGNIDEYYRKIEQKKRVEEIQHEININKIIILAEEKLLKSKQKHSEKDVDSDWLHRWRENAKNINKDILKIIWANVLVGEVKSPGSYSLRTLEFMKNISQEEAQALEKLGPFVTDEGKLFRVPLLEQEQITLGFLLKLDVLGIVSGVEVSATGLQFNMPSQKQDKYFNIIINRNRILIIEAKEVDKNLSLGVYQISKIGAEVLSLGDFGANEGYMRQLGEKIKSMGFDVKIADWEQTYVTDKEVSGEFLNPTQI